MGYSPSLGTLGCLLMYLLFQTLPTPNDGRLEGNWEDVPQPVEGVAEQSIPQDPRLNFLRHDVAGYHPPMLGVSNFGLSDKRLSLTNDI